MHIRGNLRKLTIHRSLTRNQMLLGGERNLVLIAALSSFIAGLTIALGTSFLLGIIIALFLWSIEIYFLMLLGKADPILSKIYIRSQKYRDFYPAKGRYNATISNQKFN